MRHQPLFIPRFRLSDSTLSGFEARVVRNGRGKPLTHFVDLLDSSEGEAVLSDLKRRMVSFEESKHKPVTLSVMLPPDIAPSVAETAADKLLGYLGDAYVEFIIDRPEASGTERIFHLVSLLKDKGGRVGVGFCGFATLSSEPLLEGIDVVKFWKAQILDHKENLAASSELYRLLTWLKGEGVDVVLDGLVTKNDVAEAILMGFDHGQGLYLSDFEKRGSRPRSKQPPLMLLNGSVSSVEV